MLGRSIDESRSQIEEEYACQFRGDLSGGRVGALVQRPVDYFTNRIVSLSLLTILPPLVLLGQQLGFLVAISEPATRLYFLSSLLYNAEETGTRTLFPLRSGAHALLTLFHFPAQNKCELATCQVRELTHVYKRRRKKGSLSQITLPTLIQSKTSCPQFFQPKHYQRALYENSKPYPRLSSIETAQSRKSEKI